MPSPIERPEPAPVIPEGLRRRLDAFRRELWRVKALEACAVGAGGLVLSFLWVYASDRLWSTPAWLRLGMLVSGVAAAACFAPYWLHRWVWRHRRESELARLIARRYPGLGDRLLGVIELERQQETRDTLSPRLRAAAMEAVAAEVSGRSLSAALPAPKHRRWGIAAAICAAVAAAAFVASPGAGWNALQRWLMPFSATERYTFTRLESPVGELFVPAGEPFEIVLRLAADSARQPRVATGRYGMQEAVEAELRNGGYGFRFPGQHEPASAVFRLGDLRHEVRVTPVPRPAIGEAMAEVAPPEYLGIPAGRIDLRTGVVPTVEGSRVRIFIGAARALADATFGPIAGEGEVTSEKELELVEGGARTPWIAVGERPFEIPFAWKDAWGIAGEKGFRVKVDARKDEAPMAYLQGIERQRVMLAEETVDFEVFAEDDFGTRRLGIEWSGEPEAGATAKAAQGEMELARGGAEERRLARPAAFSPAAFSIHPQRLALRAYAEDAYPGRGRVYSEPVILHVLTRDEHAQLLKTRFDRNLGEFEDLARRELNLYEENQRLERLEGGELQQEDNRRRLGQQERDEAENTRRMEELTERMETLLQDATRNGEIDKEAMQRMAQALKAMQELSREEMPEVEDLLGEAGDASNAPEQVKERLAEAVEKQEEVVEKMRQALERANEAGNRLEGGTFVNRLKKAAAEQGSLAAALIAEFEALLGEKPPELDPSDQRLLNETGQRQAATASDVRWIQEDLGHYFARTENEAFREVWEAMRDSRIDANLEEVRMNLAKNHSYRATEGARQSAAHLQEWAKRLEGEMQETGPGGAGNSGGTPDPEDEDFEFMLRVMKMVQQQQDLRARTRVLENYRRAAAQGKEEP